MNSRKDKSLRVMSQKFVMLFLVSQPRVVSLEVAGRILIGEDQVADQDKSKFKSEYVVQKNLRIRNLRMLDCTAGCEVPCDTGVMALLIWISSSSLAPLGFHPGSHRQLAPGINTPLASHSH